MSNQPIGQPPEGEPPYEPATSYRGWTLNIEAKDWQRLTIDDVQQMHADWSSGPSGVQETQERTEIVNSLMRPGDAESQRKEIEFVIEGDLHCAAIAKDQTAAHYVQQKFDDGHIEQGFLDEAGEKRHGIWVGTSAEGERSFTFNYDHGKVTGCLSNDGQVMTSWGMRFTEEDREMAQAEGYKSPGEMLEAEASTMLMEQRSVLTDKEEVERDKLLAQRFKELNDGQEFDSETASAADRDKFKELEAELNGKRPEVVRFDDHIDGLGDLRPDHREIPKDLVQKSVIRDYITRREAPNPGHEVDNSSKEPKERSSVMPAERTPLEDSVGLTGRVDLHKSLTAPDQESTPSPSTKPQGRLINGIDVTDPQTPFKNGDVARKQADLWDKALESNEYQTWQARTMHEVRKNVPMLARAKNATIAENIKSDWETIGKQIDTIQGKNPGSQFVEMKHPDGSHEVGIVAKTDNGIARDGAWIGRDPEGKVMEMASFDKGKPHGESVKFDQHGFPMKRGFFDQGQPKEVREYNKGEWTKITKYDAEGKVQNELTREESERRKQQAQERANAPVVSHGSYSIGGR